MRRTYLLTSEVARAVGVHPNTVRLYEQWGFIPPVPRTSSGYRRFSRAHLEHMRLARLALHGGWPGQTLRRSALELVRTAASGDLGEALELAYRHLALVQAERSQAAAALEYLNRWASGIPTQNSALPENERSHFSSFTPTRSQPLTIGKAARLLGLTVDTLRSWERNGLIRVPRDPGSGYRYYGPPEIGRLRVIRMLMRSGYSAMAVLRALSSLDNHTSQDLRQVLDTPRPDEEVFSAADRWLTTLDEHEERALQLIAQVESMFQPPV
jgi:DNA-binding transcriptional MerR regulator